MILLKQFEIVSLAFGGLIHQVKPSPWNLTAHVVQAADLPVLLHDLYM